MRDRVGVTAYRTAERLLRHRRPQLVLGGNVRPHWIAGGDRFWYAVDTHQGKRFVLVEPATGVRKPAFDHERLADQLSAASGNDVDAGAFPFDTFELVEGTIEFDAFDARWRCRLDNYACEQIARRPSVSFLEVPSPDGAHVVFLRHHNLWVRSLQDGQERQLTTDGEADHDYGTGPDWFMYSTLIKKFGFPHMPPAVVWSPDSTRVLTHRLDQRSVRQTHLIDAMPADGGAPKLVTQRYPFAGDERFPTAEYVVLDVAAGTVVEAKAGPVLMSIMSPISTGWAWWAEDGSAVYYLSQPRDVRTLRLHRMDPTTGVVSTILSESGETRVEPTQWNMGAAPIVRILPNGRKLLWYSQRDGWGHLYLYDVSSGDIDCRVTAGEWAVQQILHIDEAQRLVYFVASGLVAADPYRRSVCRVGLDGTDFVRITDDDLDHAVSVPSSAAYFIDTASTVETPPFITVRGWDGRVLVELETADISRLVATGWTPPQRFRVTAADGVTDIYGVLHLPHGFDPALRYPILDHVYPGPQVNRVSPSFDSFFGPDAEAFAALGFVVIAVDGRGTPGRSKGFFDAGYGKLEDAGGLVDHVAALRQLARTRPWMDLDRIGIFGDSGGGYATVRGLCVFPETYKAGVASCGSHDIRYLNGGAAEMFQGPPDEADYARASNEAIAHRLEGKLLLIHGGMDDNIHPHLTMRLVEALIAADKDFDLLIMPGAEHLYLGYEHHLYRRRWDFMVRHLLGAEPPKDFRLSPIPTEANFLTGWF